MLAHLGFGVGELRPPSLQLVSDGGWNWREGGGGGAMW